MSRYPLNLPIRLKQEAEHWAGNQGVSLNQFVVWAVAEKVGGLKQQLDDPNFPQISYRLGASRWPVPVLRGTGIRVQTLVISATNWDMSMDEIAQEYDLKAAQVSEALAFYKAHQREMDLAMAAEEELEPQAV